MLTEGQFFSAAEEPRQRFGQFCRTGPMRRCNCRDGPQIKIRVAVRKRRKLEKPFENAERGVDRRGPNRNEDSLMLQRDPLMLRSTFVAMAVVVGLGVPTPAHARNPSANVPAGDSCFSESSSPRQRIVACTALIGSKSLGAEKQASALLSRAAAYGQIGEYGRVIEDANRAIRRTPSAVAYYGRCYAGLSLRG
jgi:hypothetical protein